MKATIRNPEQLVSLAEERFVVPSALMRLGRIGDAPANVAELIEIVDGDAVLKARILGLANSGYCTNITGIDTATLAVATIGARQTRDLALAITVMRTFSDVAWARHYAEAFWLHSIWCAILAELLSYEADPAISETAFSVGLVHDVGWLLLLLAFPQRIETLLATLSNAHEPVSYVTAERRLCGFDHAQVGLELAERWWFPAAFRDGMAHHHDLVGARQQERLTAIMHIANSFASEDCGTRADTSRVDPAVWEIAGIASDVVPDALEETARQYPRVTTLLMRPIAVL